MVNKVNDICDGCTLEKRARIRGQFLGYLAPFGKPENELKELFDTTYCRLDDDGNCFARNFLKEVSEWQAFNQ